MIPNNYFNYYFIIKMQTIILISLVIIFIALFIVYRKYTVFSSLESSEALGSGNLLNSGNPLGSGNIGYQGRGVVTSVRGNKIDIDLYFYDFDSKQPIYDDLGNLLKLSPESSHSDGIVTSVSYTLDSSGTSPSGTSLSEGDVVHFDAKISKPLTDLVQGSFEVFGEAHQNPDETYTSIVKVGKLSEGDRINFRYYNSEESQFNNGSYHVSNVKDNGKSVTFSLSPPPRAVNIYYFVV